MNTFLVLAWLGVGCAYITHIAVQDPEAAKLLETCRQSYEGLSYESQQNETDSQRTLELLAPILARVDWFAVSLISSAGGFTLLGFLGGRWLKSPDWLGGLPLFALISGKNPAMLSQGLAAHGVSNASLTPTQQALTLALQIACVYASGSLSARLKSRQTPPSPPPDHQFCGEDEADREGPAMPNVTEYESARQGWAISDTLDLAVLRLTGPDRADFLQRLLTNDVRRPPGRGCHAFYLNVQGRPLLELFLFELGEETLLLLPAEQLETALQELDKMHFSEKLRFSHDKDCRVLLSAGPKRLLPSRAQSWTVEPCRVGELTAQVLSFPYLSVPHELYLAPAGQAQAWMKDWREQGGTPVGPETLRILRWEAGHPLLSEVGDQAMFLEIAEPDCYCETKGCYPGQEVVARTLHRGHINKKLCLLASSEPVQSPPEAGSRLRCQGQEAGTWLCGGHHPAGHLLGLGIVRRNYWEAGSVIETDTAIVQVQPFQRPAPQESEPS